MKKWLLALLLLTVLGAGLLIGATVVLVERQDQVTFTEVILLGENRGLEGLTADYHAETNNLFYWDSRYHFGTGKTQTVGVCDYDRPWPETVIEYRGLYLQSEIHTLFFNDPEFYTGPYEKLGQALNQLKAETAAGEENVLRLRMRDYLDYYPIGGILDLPKTVISFDASGSEDMEKALYNAFSNFFRIPILPEEEYEVRCDRRSPGSVSGSGPSGADGFQLEQISLYTGSTCYFTFSPYSWMGQPVDTSLIPGGFGIYAMDFTMTVDGQGVPLPDTLRNAFPLDPSERVMELYADESGNILLFTSREGEVTLRVLDGKSHQCLQQLPLASLGETTVNTISLQRDDEALICAISYEMLAVLTQEADGSWLHRFTVPMEHEQGRYDGRNISYAYRDGRLAMTYIPRTIDQREVPYREWCMFALAVYEETGLTFHANYFSSLSYTELAYESFPGGADAEYISQPVALNWE